MTSDDELERRLRELKGLPSEDPFPGSAPPGTPAPGSPAASASGRPAAPPPASRAEAVLEGEVIEPRRGTAGPGGRAAGTAGYPGRNPGGSADPGAPGGVGTRVVAWSLGEGAAGRIGLWIGAGLVAIGGYYVLAAFFPGIRVIGSLGVAVLGVLLLAAALTGRAGGWARSVGTLLIGFGVLPFIAGVIGLGGNGWGSLGAGLALLVLAVLRRRAGRGWGWQAPVGVVIAIWGGWGALGNLLPGFPSLGDLIVPAILVLIGLSFVRRGVGPSGPPRT